MKVKVGKDLEGGSKKREEAGNDNPLASTFARQQTVHDLHKDLEAYNITSSKGKRIGFTGGRTPRCSVYLLYWYKRTCFTGTKVQILTPEEDLEVRECFKQMDLNTKASFFLFALFGRGAKQYKQVD